MATCIHLTTKVRLLILVCYFLFCSGVDGTEVACAEASLVAGMSRDQTSAFLRSLNQRTSVSAQSGSRIEICRDPAPPAPMSPPPPPSPPASPPPYSVPPYPSAPPYPAAPAPIAARANQANGDVKQQAVGVSGPVTKAVGISAGLLMAFIIVFLGATVWWLRREGLLFAGSKRSRGDDDSESDDGARGSAKQASAAATNNGRRDDDPADDAGCDEGSLSKLKRRSTAVFDGVSTGIKSFGAAVGQVLRRTKDTFPGFAPSGGAVDAEVGGAGADGSASVEIQTPKHGSSQTVVNPLHASASFKSGSIAKMPKVAMTASQLHQQAARQQAAAGQRSGGGSDRNGINNGNYVAPQGGSASPAGAMAMRSPPGSGAGGVELYYLVHDNSPLSGFKTNRSTASSLSGESAMSMSATATPPYGQRPVADNASRAQNISPRRTSSGGVGSGPLPALPAVLSLGQSPDRPPVRAPPSPHRRAHPSPPPSPKMRAGYISGRADERQKSLPPVKLRYDGAAGGSGRSGNYL